MVSEVIEKAMLRLRGQRVLLDSELARLYGIESRVLLREFRRNLEHFPPKSVFQLTVREYESVRSRAAVSHGGRKRKSRPFAFTELGVAGLSKILQGRHELRTSIRILRTFRRLRRRIATGRTMTRKFRTLNSNGSAQIRTGNGITRELESSVRSRKH